MIRSLLLAGLLAVLPLHAANAANTAERPQLRSQVTASSAIMTIGDFFIHPGPHADRALFRAPDIGRTGTVAADDVMARALDAGLANADDLGLDKVVVHRAALTVSSRELDGMIRAALAERIGIDRPDTLDIRYSGNLPELQADPNATDPVRVERLDYNSRSGHFDATFIVTLGTRAQTLAFAGMAQRTVEVVTLAQRVSRGDRVSAHDLETMRIPRNRFNDTMVVDPTDVVGMAARRGLAAGRPLLARDFVQPLSVHRRDKVILTYRTSGLTLTVQGKALANGVDGDVIDVLNSQSRRTVRATVTGPGRVSVAPRTARFASIKENRQ